MAYRFDGTDDDVRFSPGAFVGHTGSAATFAAALIKRNANGAWMGVVTVADNGGTTVLDDLLEFDDTNHLATWPGAGSSTGSSSTITDTSNWMIVAVTTDPPGTPRFHWKIGAGAWVHQNATGSLNSARTSNYDSSDRLLVGTDPSGGDDASMDVVCVGMFAGTPTDLEVESLSLTDFADWEAFGFDWLVGFEDSGTQADRTAGGGDEVSRSGTTLVSDPAGWSWGAGSGQTLDVGKVATAEAVEGVTLSQAGPDTLGVGKVPSSEAVEGVTLSQAGPDTLSVGKVASGATVRGADIANASAQTLSVGKVASAGVARGANVTQAGPTAMPVGKASTVRLSGPLPYNWSTGPVVWGVTLAPGSVTTLDVGKVPSAEDVRGVTLSQSGPVAQDVGKVPSSQAVRGVTLTSAGADTLSVGKVPSAANLPGVTLVSGTPLTLAVGKVSDADTVRGVTLAQAGPDTLAVGRVASGQAVHGATLSNGAALTLAVGHVPSAAAVRGVTATQGLPSLVVMSLSATARYSLTLRASHVHTLDLGAEIQ